MLACETEVRDSTADEVSAGAKGFFTGAVQHAGYSWGLSLHGLQGCRNQGSHTSCRGWYVFHTDAEAEGDWVALGGWESVGGVSPSQARWFSVRLTRANAPWAFCKGEPYKCIAALELAAVPLFFLFAPQ